MSEDQIRRVLRLLQIPFQEKGNRLAMCCPFHHDTDPSAAFYLDTGFFHCFGEDQTHTDLTGFYARVRETSRSQAERDLEKTIGLIPLPPREADLRLLDRKRREGEKLLKTMRHLPRREHGRLGEDLDRILLAYERGQIDGTRLQKLLEAWGGRREEDQTERTGDLE